MSQGLDLAFVAAVYPYLDGALAAGLPTVTWCGDRVAAGLVEGPPIVESQFGIRRYVVVICECYD